MGTAYQKTLFILMITIGLVLMTKWVEFSANYEQLNREFAVAEQKNVVASELPTLSREETIPTLQQEKQSSVEGLEKDQKKMVLIQTDKFVLEIDPIGAKITSLKLKNHKEKKSSNEGYVLFGKREKRGVFLPEDGLLSLDVDFPNHNSEYQVVENKFEYTLEGNGEIEVSFSWQNESGVRLIKSYVFDGSSYDIEISYSIQNESSSDVSAYQYNQFLLSQNRNREGGFFQLPSYSGGTFFTKESKYQKLGYDDIEGEKGSFELSGSGIWAGGIEQYFTGLWIPKNVIGAKVYAKIDKSREGYYRIGYQVQSPAKIVANNSETLSTTLYAGPKIHSVLKEIGKENSADGLPLVIDFGALTFIANPLFAVLNTIYKFIGNWGWSIVILTALIKLVFFPLANIQYKSMAKMKRLQPRMQTLKDRYKDDRQAYQLEVMKLYKQEKANPAGGCLPVLVQIPVFIALYWVLLESVELRHAPYILWLRDLSAPDPFFVLPVLMGFCLWVMQKLNQTPLDPIQAKVMNILPIVMVILFLSFPQGLVLYWLVNNVLSIAQQQFINLKYAN